LTKLERVATFKRAIASQKSGEAFFGRPADKISVLQATPKNLSERKTAAAPSKKKAGASLRKIWGRRKAPGRYETGTAARLSGGKEARKANEEGKTSALP
jgi:hypothetical protein